MTFRDVARRYLGWCPGFNRIIDQTQRDINLNLRLLTLSTTVFLVAIISASILGANTFPIAPGNPLQVYIPNGAKQGVYLDSGFNQTFDYSAFLTDKYRSEGPIFFEPVNAMEYAQRPNIVISTSQFATVNEIINYTMTLDMPNSVRECVRWLISQDFNATYIKVWGEPRRYLGGAIGADFGAYRASSMTDFVHYDLSRVAQYGGINNNEGYEGYLVITDGLSLVKYSGSSAVWYLGIEGCGEFPFELDPRYKVRIVHYPVGNIRGAVPGG